MLPPGVVQLMIVLLTLAVLGIAWLLVLGIAAAQVFGWVTHNRESLTPVPHWLWILGAIALLVVVLSCVDVTSLSLAGAVVRGIIKYPAAADLGENDTGLLIVAKAVLWQDLPDWVLTYGAGKSGESFPNDKTSDQWFNEAAEEPIPPEELHPRWCTPEPTAKAPDRQRPASPWPRPSVL